MTGLEIRGANDIRRRLAADIRDIGANAPIERSRSRIACFRGQFQLSAPARFTLRAFMAATRIVSPERIDRFRSRINASA